jgi:chromosome transmission fidelity protein 18
MYLRLKEEQHMAVTSFLSSGHLLHIPVSRLRQKLEDERHRKLIEQSEKLSEELRAYNNATEDNEIEESVNDAVMSHGKQEIEPSKHSLWVDKYSPKHFTELLSDDGTNRMLLSWLKMWDRVVFGETNGPMKHVRLKAENEVINRKSKGNEQKTDGEMQHSNWPADPVKGLDASGRPLQKIALLCGSPGLGKTTLTHVLAKHCGYNVVEMNASDDRSPDAFQNWLESATQMQSVLKSDRKPNCLVIDEIDGAPTATINVLLSLIKKTPRGGGGKGEKSRKKKISDLLSRPVVCICNDLYAPSLRQLRPLALVLSFSSTSSARLASRLHQVAQQESMNAEMSALMTLCQKAENDIRSCLNTLQFIHGQGASLTSMVIRDIHVGQKDGHKSLFDLWHDVFRLSKNQRSNKPSLSTIGWTFQSPLERTRQNANISSTSLQARFSQVMSVAQASGEYEKVIQGIFENYLNVRVKDPHLEAVRA